MFLLLPTRPKCTVSRDSRDDDPRAADVGVRRVVRPDARGIRPERGDTGCPRSAGRAGTPRRRRRCAPVDRPLPAVRATARAGRLVSARESRSPLPAVRVPRGTVRAHPLTSAPPDGPRRRRRPRVIGRRRPPRTDGPTCRSGARRGLSPFAVRPTRDDVPASPVISRLF